MLEILGRKQNTCEGVSRRRLLQVGGTGLLGLNVRDLLAAEHTVGESAGRAKSVIFMFLFGGPSQLETFDMKPQATDAIRGPFQPIASRTPGLRICEHLPLTAQVTDKCTVVRTMSHAYNDHSGAGHYIQTGRRWHVPIGGGFNVTPQDWPSMGSVVEYLAQKNPSHRTAEGSDSMPSYAVVPNSLGRLQEYKVQLRRPGETAGWLGRGYDPITTRIEKKDSADNPYWRDCTDDELTFRIDGLLSPKALTLDRLQRRGLLLKQFDQQRTLLDSASIDVFDRFQQRAMALVSSTQTAKALDITREPAALRDRYGRHLFGQSTLMARRLIEAGTRFATVHYDCVDGYSWDSHRNSNSLKNHLIPTMDQALSALLTDLDDRGMLDETLVVCVGEMGRTPKANKSWGRDHWSTVFPAVIAGAGIRRGALYGETDKDGGYATTQPVSPDDLAATIYHALGIDPHLRVPDAQGRPTHVVNGEPVLALFG